MKRAKNKKNFASFDITSALQHLQLETLVFWQIEYTPCPLSDFFQERMQRLQVFDLTSSERAKELLIDAVCEEALTKHPRLKAWKAAALESDDTIGVVDYLVAPNRRYVAGPLVCVVEAKKDDFEQGLAQCLVEMQACAWNNQQSAAMIDVFGIVTNGEGWKFYKLAIDGKVYETTLMALYPLENLLGCLYKIFSWCEQSLS